MKSPYFFVVRPFGGRRYNNVDVSGIITSSSKEDHTVTNRIAEVISVPIHYDGEVEAGDLLLVHHNVFRFYNDTKGRERSGFSFVFGDTYIIEPVQYFMYFKNGEWRAHGDYCFVEPIKVKDSELKKLMSHEPLMGIMRHSNENLRKIGVNEGDLVSFAPGSEYEFKMGSGDILYRMYTKNICIKHD